MYKVFILQLEKMQIVLEEYFNLLQSCITFLKERGFGFRAKIFKITYFFVTSREENYSFHRYFLQLKIIKTQLQKIQINIQRNHTPVLAISQSPALQPIALQPTVLSCFIHTESKPLVLQRLMDVYTHCTLRGVSLMPMELVAAQKVKTGISLFRISL